MEKKAHVEQLPLVSTCNAPFFKIFFAPPFFAPKLRAPPARAPLLPFRAIGITMPKPTGAETIAERLTRLRAALVRVRNTIARVEDNGQASNITGHAITELSYDRALKRERELTAEIAALEARLAGAAPATSAAQLVTRFD